MINIKNKFVNTKFIRLLKFVFHLRYLFLILLISLILAVGLPNFFDFNKKKKIISKFLSQNYNLEVKEIGDIQFKSLPLPRLEINNLDISLDSDQENLKTKNLTIFTKLIYIYNFRDFKANKIILKDSTIKINFKKINNLKKYLLKPQKKISFENLDLFLNDNDKSFLEVKNINFSNYGFKKNIINGKVFNEKFRIKLKDNLKKIDLDLLRSSIALSINLNKFKATENLSGNVKGKFFKSNIKSDFIFDQKSLAISNLFFRNKSLSFNSNGKMKLSPYFKFKIFTNIKDIDKRLLKNVDIPSLLDSKEIIKKINGESIFFLAPTKFIKRPVEKIKVKLNFEYGRLNFVKELLFSDTNFSCSGDINLLLEYPVIEFSCFMNSQDKKKFLKLFDINYNEKKEELRLNFDGNLNILNNKINFYNVEDNKFYKASQQELKYFKKSFESIILNENFIEIFNFSKFKNFVREIS
tara:strand:+ start:2092 stop:3495 length:1404 start_codon:yes stop_codon:yes gene_type:complete